MRGIGELLEERVFAHGLRRWRLAWACPSCGLVQVQRECGDAEFLAFRKANPDDPDPFVP